MTEKTATQIEKDKEAVAKMIGAKSAMEAAIRRIETLELALKTTADKVDSIRKAYSEDTYINVYVTKESGFRPVKVRDIFTEIDALAKRHL